MVSGPRPLPKGLGFREIVCCCIVDPWSQGGHGLGSAMVPWHTWFENWGGQIVLSGPRALPKGAGSRKSLLLQSQSLVPWWTWCRLCHGSMAYVVRELGGSDSGLGAETTPEGCGF